MEGYKLIFKSVNFSIYKNIKSNWYVMMASNGQSFPMGLDEVRRTIQSVKTAK